MYAVSSATTNLPPTVTLNNKVSVADAVKVAELALADDGIGSNTLTVIDSFGSAIALTGVISSAPSDSVIFIESATATTFRTLWFGSKRAPAAPLAI